MKKELLLAMVLFVMTAINLFAGISFAEEKASPKEVIQKIKEAAALLSLKGEAAMSEFNDRNGPWVWKDTYVFVTICKKGIIVAHPIKPSYIGRIMINLRDTRGTQFFAQFCKVAKNATTIVNSISISDRKAR